MHITTNRPRADRRKRGYSSPPVLLLIALGAVLIAGALGLFLHDGADRIDVGGPFVLTTGAGKTVTDRDLRGKYLLVYFGYTYCPDVCPTTLAQIAAALDALGPKGERLQPVFITVDPQRDTPETIGQYTKLFTPRLLGLTGSEEKIKAVEKEYHVYAAIRRTGPGKDEYSVDHSSILYLMGPDGKFISVIRADLNADQLAAEIAKQIS